VLSVGGYASGPVTLAAAVCGVPVAVLEPNRVVGLANRLIAPWAKRAYLAWDDVAPKFRAGVSRVFGVPLRGGFEPRPYVLRDGERLLVLGGSQGAAALNECVPKALSRLKGELPHLRVVHQTGHGRDAAVRDAYLREGASDVVVLPFVEDVASVLAEADVVIARAGAGTIAEIAAIGRPAILVPYPHAADDHQRRNAEAMSQIGAARWVRDEAADPARLATEVRLLFGDGPARAAMAEASRGHGRPSAARDVAADLLSLAGIGLRRLAEAS
jgi:UDP-N-acetylglucosamine--N-acetylmuramyl-(pentapeptide) pyrophosphoryl-undecaprenol N-acetylglucosamine transferase